LKNIETGVLEKWRDVVLGLNHYSSTPRLHYSKLLSELKCLKSQKEKRTLETRRQDKGKWKIGMLAGRRQKTGDRIRKNEQEKAARRQIKESHDVSD
jgi:hypothetical protein